MVLDLRARCDFGSAKILARGEPNVAYICSRYYRAPELIFSASDYTTTIGLHSFFSFLVPIARSLVGWMCDG